MKYLMLVLVLSGCTTQNIIEDAPKYAGARSSSAEGDGWYATISGNTDAVGCGVGTSEAPLNGRLSIKLKTDNGCELEYEQ